MAFGRVTARRIVVFAAVGGLLRPRVVAGRFVIGGDTFSVLVECHVRERTGPMGSFLSIARFSLRQKKLNISLNASSSPLTYISTVFKSFYFLSSTLLLVKFIGILSTDWFAQLEGHRLLRTLAAPIPRVLKKLHGQKKCCLLHK